MVRILRYVTVVISLLISCYYAAAQNVEVVSCGEGSNKQEAEYNALRNALESSCGVFLDAHTEMVDDVLTEDRISIISKGSVASFKELSSYVDESCRYHVTMSVTIGMNKMAEMLSESVVEKSGAVEVDLSSLSNVYKFNQKQMELNKENERRIVDALMEDVSRILRIGGDFSDIYNTKLFLGRLNEIKIAIKEKLPLIFLPQTIGPFSIESNCKIAKDILRYASRIYVRDDRYVSELKEFGVIEELK